MQTQVNFGRWLERLGTKIADQPEYLNVVQPTTLVRDERDIVSPAPGRWGFAGGTEPAVLLEFAGMRLSPGGHGGYTFAHIEMGSSGQAQMWVKISATTSTVANTTALVVGSMDENRPVRATALRGEFDDFGPIIATAPAAVPLAVADVWVPPGHFLEFGCDGNNIQADLSCKFLEFPPENAP